MTPNAKGRFAVAAIGVAVLLGVILSNRSSTVLLQINAPTSVNVRVDGRLLTGDIPEGKARVTHSLSVERGERTIEADGQADDGSVLHAGTVLEIPWNSRPVYKLTVRTTADGLEIQER